MWNRNDAPVCCKQGGHIFCKNCIIENLMKQKKNNEKQYIYEKKEKFL